MASSSIRCPRRRSSFQSSGSRVSSSFSMETESLFGPGMGVSIYMKFPHSIGLYLPLRRAMLKPVHAAKQKEVLMILIIGATGTIGREAVAKLVEKGEKVRALSRDPE